MKKSIKLLLMILLGIAGICLTGAAIYGALMFRTVTIASNCGAAWECYLSDALSE